MDGPLDDHTLDLSLNLTLSDPMLSFSQSVITLPSLQHIPETRSSEGYDPFLGSYFSGKESEIKPQQPSILSESVLLSPPKIISQPVSQPVSEPKNEQIPKLNLESLPKPQKLDHFGFKAPAKYDEKYSESSRN